MSVDRSFFLSLPKSSSIDIEFENIVCSVSDGKKGKRQILSGVSGKFKSGELTGILGPSGAGKTTLLNTLTGFRSVETTGIIKCNGSSDSENLGSSQYKKKSCYIQQDDELAPFFTAFEIMYIASDLKLGNSISAKAKKMMIEDILETLGLTECKNTRCQRLSTGQQKRLSIALELIDNPPIMFLDEPTTGLDSSSSLHCIALLKALARNGKTIVCTIHQPNASVYEMFDQIYVIAKGKCIYQGTSPNTVPFLSSVGLNCPQYHNPADYIIEVASDNYGNFTDFLATASQVTNWKIPSKDKLDEQLTTKDKNPVKKKSVAPIEPPSEWSKFITLTNRSFLQIVRDWQYSFLKIFIHLVVGIFLGFTYFHAGNDGSKMITNLGFLMVSVVYVCYTAMLPSVLKFPSEIRVLKKEKFNNWYQLKTYYAAVFASDLPLQALFAIAYSSFSYILSDQPKDLERFMRFLFILFLVGLTSSSFGLLLGSSVSPVNGIFLGSVWVAVMVLGSGFLLLYKHMNKYLFYLSYTSFLSFSFDGLAQAVHDKNRGPVPCPEDIDYCQFKLPIDLLKEMALDRPNYWTDVSYLFFSFVVFRIIAFFYLKRKLRQ